jgi:signal transduction histidine kinase
MRRRAFWFSRSSGQAQVEIFLLGGSIWLGLFLFQVVIQHIPSETNEGISGFYINMICVLWFILRLSLPARFLSKDTLKQFLSSLIVALGLNVFSLLLFFITFILFHRPLSMSIYDFGMTLLLAVCVCLFLLLIIIGTLHIVRFGNNLRQSSLQWSLIYAHIVVAVFLLAVVGLFSIRSHILPYLVPVPRVDALLLPGIFFASLLFFWILFPLLLVLVPPLILFAYLVTHSTIKRIQALVMITNELRRGHYDTRAIIEGKDEVAQLQKNFNIMADELEHVIRDLQTERDHVASLLDERRNFFANVSHELRTPIATLRGYLESTLKDPRQLAMPTLWEDLAVMEREVVQLQERTDELFALSKAEVGQIIIQDVPCNVCQFVQTLVDSYAPLAWRTNKVEIVADIPDEVPLVKADEQHVELALKNIMRNALRHTPPGGVIALLIAIEAERVGISIEDTGEGIAPEELEHIWERFYQARTAQKPGGAGIGLSLVKDWITAMGGSVAATSTLGEGSCFTLYLPRVDGQDDRQRNGMRPSSVSHRNV